MGARSSSVVFHCLALNKNLSMEAEDKNVTNMAAVVGRGGSCRRAGSGFMQLCMPLTGRILLGIVGQFVLVPDLHRFMGD